MVPKTTIVENQLDANELKGQVIRLLESYPDHPGLLYLRSMTELLTKTKDIFSANNDLKYAVSSSIYRYSQLLQIGIVLFMNQWSFWEASLKIIYILLVNLY